jgi:hypothetical protein
VLLNGKTYASILAHAERIIVLIPMTSPCQLNNGARFGLIAIGLVSASMVEPFGSSPRIELQFPASSSESPTVADGAFVLPHF